MHPLLAASHPLPSAAVTGLALLMGLATRAPARRLVTLTVAVGSGQVAVGCLNDVVDAGRDAAVGRADKPVATGDLGRGTATAVTAGALGVCVPASLALGRRAGAAHLGAVACGLAYDLGVKATPASWLPYAGAFGLLPSAVLLARTGGRVPWWAPVAGGLLGVGGHLANALPDRPDDLATDVRGLPATLPPARAAALTAGSLGAAVVVLAVGARPGWIGVAGPALAGPLCALAARPPRSPRDRRALLAAVAVSGVAVGMLGAALAREATAAVAVASPGTAAQRTGAT